MKHFLGNRRKWRLLVRFVTGESHSKEEAEIEALISVDNESAERLDDLKKLWQKTRLVGSRVDANLAWERIRPVLESDANVRPLVKTGSSRAGFAPRRSHNRGIQFFRLAAVVAGVALLSSFLLWYVSEQQALVASGDSQVFATKKGQRATVQLPDGTLVQLQAGSQMEIPVAFSDAHRDVILHGEAFFNVSEDVNLPFRVQTPLTTVEVLGTAFNVRAFPDDENVRVAVAEGEVALHLRNRADTLHLRPRDLGIVHRNKGYTLRQNVDLARHLAWTEGRLVFQNAAFYEVATELERWYDLEVELVGTSTEGDGLTAEFGVESLSEILSAISLALNLEYKREQRRVTFFPAR